MATAVTFVAGGCGGDRRDANAPKGTFSVAIERASFAKQQRLAEKAEFVITVRNAGTTTIPNLVVTLRGFTDRAQDSRLADPGRDLWVIDEPPAGTPTAIDDTWAAGRLEPDRSATLRWRVTPVVAGTHELSYDVAPAVAGDARAQVAGGGPARGTVTVRVTDKPAKARVDPRSGRVLRRE